MKLREVVPDAEGSGLHIGVAAASYNAVISNALVDGALEALQAGGVTEVTVVRVAGALELPVIALHLARAGCDAVVALGAVIEGETDHYTHVATQTAAGIKDVGLQTGIPVTNGVLTVTELAHASARSQPGPGNKGFEAAEAAVRAARAVGRLQAR